MKDQEVSDAELYELLARAVTAFETITKGFEDLNRCPRCGAVMTWCGEGDLRCFSCQEPPAEEPCEHEYEPGPENWICVKCGGGKPYDSAPPVFGPDDPEPDPTMEPCPNCGEFEVWEHHDPDQHPMDFLECKACHHRWSEEPPAALTRSEEEILRDPRPGKGVIVTEGYTPPPAEELRAVCPNCHETVVRIYADPENGILRCPECRYTWDVDE